MQKSPCEVDIRYEFHVYFESDENSSRGASHSAARQGQSMPHILQQVVKWKTTKLKNLLAADEFAIVPFASAACPWPERLRSLTAHPGGDTEIVL